MRAEITNSSLEVDDELSNDFTSILENSDERITPFMNLFWQQQKKLLTSSHTGERYHHPMIIRFCLSHAAKSPSCYEELRNSKVLVLPSQKRLKDYRNAIRPQRGFQEEVVEEFKVLTDPYFWCTEICGSVIWWNEGDIKPCVGQSERRTDWFYWTMVFWRKQMKLLNMPLHFLYKGSAQSSSLALYILQQQVSQQHKMMPLFWKAVAILETSCNLWVIAASSDGVSPNRRFYRLHKPLDGGADTCATIQ